MVSKVWDFGDSTFSTMNDPSHFYTKAGVYNVKLNIVGIGGCTSVLTKQIVLRGPRGSFSYNARTGCNPLSITFIGHTEEAAKFIWDFNDGNIQETVDSNVVHVFTDPGSFLPKMILEDSTGCRVPIPGIDTILVKGVVAKFKFNDNGESYI
jgi:PKD repeat protein